MEEKELTLNEIQENSFEVLKKIKEIFDANNWKYYLTGGTLIGAIRHKGFVPWDDDIDIWVPREYYEKFVKYCKENKEQLKPFELIHYSTNDKYIYPISRFSDTRFRIDYDNAKNYGLGLFVDVYPLDGIDNKDKKFKKKIIWMTIKINLMGKTKCGPSKSIIKSIFKHLYYLIIKNGNLNKLLEKLDKLSQKYDFNSSEYFNCVCWNLHLGRIYKKDLLDGGDNLECFKEFNGEMFRVPYKYDELLRIIYGDYMKLPPEKDRIAHHFYKAYKKN